MSKHPMDRRKPSTGEKTRVFLGLERQATDRLHPATQALHQRGTTERGDTRLRQFLRIERGHSA